MPVIDYSDWRFWAYLINSAVNIGVWIYVWRVNRQKAVDSRFAKIEKAMAKAFKEQQEKIDTRCEKRTARIEVLEKESRLLDLRLQHMPTHQDIKEMSEKMEKVQRSMSKLSGRLEGINRAVDLLNEHHINNSGGNNAGGKGGPQ